MTPSKHLRTIDFDLFYRCNRELHAELAAKMVPSERTKKYSFGILVDKWDETLTNLRFADDLLLLAQSPRDIGKMLKDLQAEARKFGLKLNSDKT